MENIIENTGETINVIISQEIEDSGNAVAGE